MSLILTDVRDGVATITLNRPEKLNAFAGSMREDLLEALRDAAGNADAASSSSQERDARFRPVATSHLRKGCKRIATSMASTSCWRQAPRSSP